MKQKTGRRLLALLLSLALLISITMQGDYATANTDTDDDAPVTMEAADTPMVLAADNDIADKYMIMFADSILYRGVAYKEYNFGEPVTLEKGKEVFLSTKDGSTNLPTSKYEVTYENNIKVGTAKLTVTGVDGYTGTLTATFEIEPISLGKVSPAPKVYLNGGAVDASKAEVSVPYTKSTTMPTVKVMLGTHELTEGTDYSLSWRNVISTGNRGDGAAAPTVMIIGRGNFQNSYDVKFTIVEADMKDQKISVSPSSYTYDGKAKTPTVTVLDGVTGAKLDEGTDYTVSYSNNTNVGTATVTVKGIGNYKGEGTATFQILSGDTTLIDISKSNRTVAVAACTYNGSPQEPRVDVVLSTGNKILKEGRDYTTTFTNNINAGTFTATVTIEGIGSYTGSFTQKFSIQPKKITDTTVSVTATDMPYNNGLRPYTTVTVKDSQTGKTLTGDDYSLAYGTSESYNVGDEVSITLTGKGNYTGTRTATYNILAIDLSGAKVTAPDCEYTGSALKPDVTVVLDGKTLKNGTDYTASYTNNTNPGTATVTVTGKGNYTGTAKGQFTIIREKVDLADATIAAIPDQTYTGSALTPAPVVTYKDAKGTTKTLEAGTDYTVSYKSNINVGTATVTITGKGNVSGSREVTFKIVAKSIKGAVVTAADQTYNGSEQKPTVTVKLDGKTLTASDYTVAYSDNTNAGKATITVTGKGNYTGTATGSFTINPKNIKDCKIADIPGQVATGDPIEPAVTVTDGSTTLKAGTDYTVEYTDNTDPGTATATVTGKGNYTGTATATFTIDEEVIAIADVTIAAIPDQTYTGSALTPAPVVTYKNAKGTTVTLKAGTNYTVSYKNNTNVGTATVTITGKGNVSGSRDVTFEIVAKSIKGATVTAADQTYNGSEQKPTVTVKLDGKTLTTSDYTVAYSDNTNAGTAKITITGKGNYTGTASGSFVIAPKDIKDCKVSDIPGQVATGSAIEPAVTITDDSTTLKAGTDYTVSYKDNTDVGTATVTITGKGNYKGSVSTTFDIAGLDIAEAEIAAIADQTYTGSAIKPAPVVTYTENGTAVTLKADVDYTVSYKNNINVGTATVTIAGKGRFGGTKSATFKITPKNLSTCKVADVTAYEYAGSAVEPDVTITDGTKTLVKDTDYTLSYENNIEITTEASPAVITITGKGNYTGTATVTFAIVPKSMANCTVSDIPEQTYTGGKITPAVTITNGGVKLIENEDYVVKYSNNVNVTGSAKITIEGIGHYSGTITKTFKIVPADISKAVIGGVTDAVYTGSAITVDDLTVALNDVQLTDADYEVSYKDNINVGTAIVVVTGKGNYTGEATTTFKISPLDISADAKVTGVKDQAYTGSEITFAGLSVTLGADKLVKDTNYTVAYTDNIKVGTATVVVTFKGNYTGEITVSFEITPASIQDATIEKIENQAYTGEPIEPKVTVVTKSGVTLKEGTDYEVTYDNNTEIGKATITVTGKGNYAGTLSGSFVIVPAAVTGLKFDYDSATTDSVSIIWDSMTGITGYHVYVYDEASEAYTLLGTTTETGYVISDLTAGTSYTLAVEAYYESDGETYTSAKTDVKAATVPDQVTDIKALDVTKDSIEVTWGRVNGATGYRIYRMVVSEDPEAEEAYVLLDEVNADTRSYIDALGLSSGTVYQYKIEAIKKFGNRLLIGEGGLAEFMTRPDDISGVSVVARSAYSMGLNWDFVPNVDGYNVYRYDAATGEVDLIKTIENAVITSFVASGLNSGATYSFSVCAYVNYNDVMIESDMLTVEDTTKTTIPVVSAAAGSEKAAVTWREVNGASGYEVYMSESEDGEYTRVATCSAGTTLTLVTDLSSQNTYYFKVRAYRSAAGKTVYSGYSTIRSVEVE